MKKQEILARGICIRDGKVLLAYFKEKEYFFLPGGHVEPGESIKVALEREIEEELGITAQAGSVVSVFEHSWKNKDDIIHEFNFLVTFSIPSNSTISPKVAHLDFAWKTQDEFETLNFLPNNLRATVNSLFADEDVPGFQSSFDMKLDN